MITRDGKSWWWYLHYGEDGMCMQYKPENYSNFKKENRRSKKDRENITLKPAGRERK